MLEKLVPIPPEFYDDHKDEDGELPPQPRESRVREP